MKNKKTVIDWESFFGSSSTVEALASFVIGRFTFKQFSRECWSKDCKQAIKQMKPKGYKKARRLARQAMQRRNMQPEDWNNCPYSDRCACS